MHSLTPTHSPRDQRLKFCLLSALSISILLFTVIHLKHIIPNHSPSFRPNCHTTNPHPQPNPYATKNVDDVVIVGEEETVLHEQLHEGPRRNTVYEVATWGFVKSDGERAKIHEGHHTVDEVAAWGFVEEDKEAEKEEPRQSSHRSSIADLDIWRLLTKHRNNGEKSHQSTHRYSITDLSIWKLLTKPSHPKDQQILGEAVTEKTQMHGNGGEVCDSFFVSDLVGCAKVVNGKFRGGEGRKKLGNFGEDWAAVEEAKEREGRKNSGDMGGNWARIEKEVEEAREKEEKVMRKEGLR